MDEYSFTQADSLRLQSLNQGMSQADDSLYSGEIDENDHQRLVEQIAQQRQPLMARAQQAKEQGFQKQQQMAMRSNAFQQGMMQQDATFRAQNFHDRIIPVVDPMTGDSQLGFVNKDGDFTPFEFNKEEQKTDMSQLVPAQQEAPGTTPQAGATIPYGTGPFGLLGLGAAGAIPAAAPGQTAQPHIMNINMGDQQYQARFGQGEEGWQQSSQKRFNRDTGRWEDMPIGAAMGETTQKPSEPGRLNDAELQELWRQANITVRGMPEGPARQHAVVNLFQHLTDKLSASRLASAEHVRQEAAKSEERKRHEGVAVQEKQRVEAEKKQKEEEATKLKVTESVNKSHHDYLGGYRKDKHDWDKRIDDAAPSEKDNIRAKMPDHLKSEEAMNDRAWDQANKHVKRLHPELYPKTDVGKTGPGASVITGKSGAKPEVVNKEYESFSKDIGALLNPQAGPQNQAPKPPLQTFGANIPGQKKKEPPLPGGIFGGL